MTRRMKTNLLSLEDTIKDFEKAKGILRQDPRIGTYHVNVDKRAEKFISDNLQKYKDIIREAKASGTQPRIEYALTDKAEAVSLFLSSMDDFLHVGEAYHVSDFQNLRKDIDEFDLRLDYVDSLAELAATVGGLSRTKARDWRLISDAIREKTPQPKKGFSDIHDYRVEVLKATHYNLSGTQDPSRTPDSAYVGLHTQFGGKYDGVFVLDRKVHDLGSNVVFLAGTSFGNGRETYAYGIKTRKTHVVENNLKDQYGITLVEDDSLIQTRNTRPINNRYLSNVGNDLPDESKKALSTLMGL